MSEGIKVKPTWLLTFLSIGALSLAVVHLFWPSLSIDGITITLVLIAILPWFAPYLKTLELPGGVKIELKDVMRATEKATGDVSSTVVNDDDKGAISTLTRIAKEDANLALIGFRIELEKRLYRAAEINSISLKSRTLSATVSELNKNGIIPDSLASSLIELVALGNKAAHGVKVSDEAAEWVLKKGPGILKNVDAHFNFKT